MFQKVSKRIESNGELMALENLYRCTNQQIDQLYRELTTVFFNDPLYVAAFPQEAKRRECMDLFFQQYIRAIASSSIFLADSAALQSVMVIYDSRRYRRFSYVWKLIKMNVHFLRFITLLGVKQSFRLLKEWDMFTSRWIKDFAANAYFHLDLVFTKPEAQHQGIATKMVKELLDEARIMDMDVTVETHELANKEWYESLGFVLMNTIVDEHQDLHQYCMLIRNNKKES